MNYKQATWSERANKNVQEQIKETEKKTKLHLLRRNLSGNNMGGHTGKAKGSVRNLSEIWNNPTNEILDMLKNSRRFKIRDQKAY